MTIWARRENCDEALEVAEAEVLESKHKYSIWAGGRTLTRTQQAENWRKTMYWKRLSLYVNLHLVRRKPTITWTIGDVSNGTQRRLCCHQPSGDVRRPIREDMVVLAEWQVIEGRKSPFRHRRPL